MFLNFIAKILNKLMRLLKKNLKCHFIFIFLIQNLISNFIVINFNSGKFHEGIHFPLIKKILHTCKFYENVFIFKIFHNI